ncbi:hypothetical protein AN641_06730 [Candidatus Epulonipiscioides gigas]|nr:hypothetical protein AN641_06730 [Epulopiscium sp. SCG-C07WGA-EpuloA2]
MNRYIFKSKLGVEILQYLIKSLIITFVISNLLFGFSIIISNIINQHNSEQSINYIKTVKQEFEEFIEQEKVKSDDIILIDTWIKRYHNINLVLIQDNKIIYASNSDTEINFMSNDELEFDFDEVMTFSIPFNDKVVITFISNDGGYSWIIIFLSLMNIVLSIIIFIYVFLRAIKNKVDYIKEIESGIKILESGDLDTTIHQIGNDELTSLAITINNMSTAMKERIDGEQRAQEANKLLITNISHDIRSPLTPIIGYLTILKENKNLSLEQKNKYLDTALLKAEQLKERTNMLFEYALLYSNQKQLNKVKVNARTVLEQFVFESTIALNNSDFETETNISINEFLEIKIDVQEISRVFDNTISNILKYGSNKFPIVFKVFTENNSVKVKISNHINENNIKVSTNLGNNICKNLLSLHQGKFEIKEEDNIYEVEITLII